MASKALLGNAANVTYVAVGVYRGSPQLLIVKVCQCTVSTTLFKSYVYE